MSNDEFKPLTVGTFKPATGGVYTIEVINKQGHCSITSPFLDVGYAKSVSKAWAHVYYQAGIVQNNANAEIHERTVDWDGVKFNKSKVK